MLTASDVAFGEERLTDLRDEAASLFAEHWAEAGTDTSEPLELNWHAYQAAETAGCLVTITARRVGRLIGYAVYVVLPRLDRHSVMIADSPMYFVTAKERRGWIGVRLFMEAEKRLKAKGAQEVIARVRLHVEPGRGGRTVQKIFEWLGYAPYEMALRKRLT